MKHSIELFTKIEPLLKKFYNCDKISFTFTDSQSFQYVLVEFYKVVDIDCVERMIWNGKSAWTESDLQKLLERT